jgi:predicted nucleic acid-binding protein
LTTGYPAIRELVARGEVRWIADEAQRIELGRVLHYSQIAPRVSYYGKTPEGVMAAFDAAVEYVSAAPKIRFTCTDPDDQHFLDLASQHKALLVSKDRAVLKQRKRVAALWRDGGQCGGDGRGAAGRLVWRSRACSPVSTGRAPWSAAVSDRLLRLSCLRCLAADSVEKLHACIRPQAALRQAAFQRTDMGFELVAIRVQKVEGIAFAAVALPFLDTA